MPRRRLAVALLVPAPIDREVDTLRRAFGDPMLDSVVPHLTLVPPVNVRDDDFDDAVAVVDRAGAATAPFRLELGPATTFWPVTPVLYLAVGDDEGRAAVASLRDRVYVPPLARPLSYEFEPHVTLGEDSERPYRLEAAVSALDEFRVEVIIDRLHLLEERRDDDGTRWWTPCHETRFGPAAIVGRGGVEIELAVTQDLTADASHLLRKAPGVDRARRDLVVTAKRDGVAVGVAVGHVTETMAVIDSIVVTPGQRRQGIGRHVLARFEAEAVGAGAEAIVARYDIGDAAAAALYAGAGFVEEARVPWAAGSEQVQVRRRLV